MYICVFTLFRTVTLLIWIIFRSSQTFAPTPPFPALRPFTLPFIYIIRVDIEFIATAHWEFGMRIVHIGDTFSCHQDHPNIWESFPERMTNNSEFLWEDLIYHRKSYANPEGKWAMLHMDIWELGLQCVEFGGGLCI